MRLRIAFLLLSIAIILINPCPPVLAQAETPTPTSEGTPVTAQGIIDAFNALRRNNNLRSLVVDPILMGLAQQTADIMAINGMTGHIGDVRGRAIAAGYGANDIPWLTENFAIGPMTLEELMLSWSDADHMRGANNQWYAHVGIGIAEYNGDVYYVMIAGYTSNRIYKPGATALPGVSVTPPISQVMYPVVRVTPGADGKVIHTVQHGQTLWAIAIAYDTHIVDIQRVNNFSSGDQTIYEGQQLVIPITVTVSTTTPMEDPAIPALTETAQRLAAKIAEFTPPSTVEVTASVATRQKSNEDLPLVIVAVLAAMVLLVFGWIGSRDKSS